MSDTAEEPIDVSFGDYAVVACGTMNLELKKLQASGFLDVRRLLFTKPGRHEVPRELETQLVKKIAMARKYADKILVVYGGKFCYLNASDPARTIDQIIDEQGEGIVRINATHCVDMLVSKEQRETIAHGEKVLWLTPGWILYRHFVFQDWDKGKANENFPMHTGGAVLLDGVDFWNQLSASDPEKILEFSDWMGIPIQVHSLTLRRFKKLLAECVAPS
jgi:hypothetical protein